MLKHERASDYISNTALFCKSVYIYSQHFHSDASYILKTFLSYGLNNYLNHPKLDTRTTLFLKSQFESCVKDFDITSIYFDEALIHYNSEDRFEKYMFYPKFDLIETNIHLKSIQYLFLKSRKDIHENTVYDREDYQLKEEKDIQNEKDLKMIKFLENEIRYNIENSDISEEFQTVLFSVVFEE
jgi:hypothetical protein